MRPGVSRVLGHVGEVVLGACDVTEKDLGHGGQLTLRGPEDLQGGPQDPEGGHRLRPHLEAPELQAGEGLEGEKVYRELVGHQLAGPERLSGAGHGEGGGVAADIHHVGEVVLLVVRIERRAGSLEPLTHSVQLQR